jgi:hypothetical protein
MTKSKQPKVAGHSSPKLAYSILEAGAAANASRTAIYRAIRDGALTARKMGRRTVILDADLRCWLNSLKPLKAA